MSFQKLLNSLKIQFMFQVLIWNLIINGMAMELNGLILKVQMQHILFLEHDFGLFASSKAIMEKLKSLLMIQKLFQLIHIPIQKWKDVFSLQIFCTIKSMKSHSFVRKKEKQFKLMHYITQNCQKLLKMFLERQLNVHMKKSNILKLAGKTTTKEYHIQLKREPQLHLLSQDQEFGLSAKSMCIMAQWKSLLMKLINIM
ncbi:hypothetical protein TRFO_30159 [Tritrichomonas foetus]|uniref:Transmembrane protein n=1 Tax=Tritrichomonas foetus TaxID=1144522 RepID=A0A1J4JYU2_9EUKA|nr:hypothetical protein TRFO_30159 [Tritrichomonas foetus]|eukprot:OHT02700.1 hypothetical protein TRFO_30159 [Tritrichomonas foetus]